MFALSWRRTLAAGLVAIIAGVHFQQYVDFMSEIPTVGVLFLLNAAGGAGLTFALLSGERRLRLLAALGGLGLSSGSLVSIAIALQASFFGYQEPGLRAPIVIAIVAEVLAVPALLAMLWQDRHPNAQTAASASVPVRSRTGAVR